MGGLSCYHSSGGKRSGTFARYLHSVESDSECRGVDILKLIWTFWTFLIEKKIQKFLKK